MLNFFKTFFVNTTANEPIELPSLPANELCHVIDNIDLLTQTKLIVGAGQVAALYAEGERSNLYPTGMHFLNNREKTFVNQHPQANVLYIQTAPPVSRSWSFSCHRVDNSSLKLQGTYTIAVENAKVLCDRFMQPNARPATTMVDDWMNKILKEIIQTQHITVDDIQTHRRRFEQFLLDAVNPIIFDKGLTLRALTVAEDHAQGLVTEDNTLTQPHVKDVTRQSPPSLTTSELASSKGATKSIAATHQTARENTIPSEDPQAIPRHIDTGPKLYYRVLNGQQDGPYSVYQLQQLIEQHSLKASDLVWKKGFSSWQRADTIDQLIWSV